MWLLVLIGARFILAICDILFHVRARCKYASELTSRHHIIHLDTVLPEHTDTDFLQRAFNSCFHIVSSIYLRSSCSHMHGIANRCCDDMALSVRPPACLPANRSYLIAVSTVDTTNVCPLSCSCENNDNFLKYKLLTVAYVCF